LPRLFSYLVNRTVEDGLYTKYQEEATKERARQQESSNKERDRLQNIEKLDFEISYRYSTILQQLFDIKEGRFDKSHIEGLQERGLLMLQTISNLRTAPGKSLYVEYSNFSMFALYAELYRNVVEKEKEDFKDTVAAISLNPFEKVDLNDAVAVATAIQRGLIDKRWRRNTYFGYLDCDWREPKPGELPYDPFC
jgi:hypothetical protein